MAPPSPPPVAPPERHNHFGPVIAACDHADLLPDSLGVAIHGDAERRHVAAPLRPAPRAEVVDELVAAVREGVPPLHSARWSLATMEVVLGILASAEAGSEDAHAGAGGRGVRKKRLPGFLALRSFFFFLKIPYPATRDAVVGQPRDEAEWAGGVLLVLVPLMQMGLQGI